MSAGARARSSSGCSCARLCAQGHAPGARRQGTRASPLARRTRDQRTRPCGRASRTQTRTSATEARVGKRTARGLACSQQCRTQAAGHPRKTSTPAGSPPPAQTTPLPAQTLLQPRTKIYERSPRHTHAATVIAHRRLARPAACRSSDLYRFLRSSSGDSVCVRPGHALAHTPARAVEGHRTAETAKLTKQFWLGIIT